MRSYLFTIYGFTIYNFGSDKEYRHQRPEESYPISAYHFSKRMLAEYHSAGSHESSDEVYHAEPPYRVELVYQGRSYQSAEETAYGSRVGRYLPLYVYQGANHLYYKSRHQDSLHHVWRVEEYGQQPIADEVATDGDHVWHHAMLLPHERQEVQSMRLVIDGYQPLWGKYRTQPNKQENLQAYQGWDEVQNGKQE